jgi:hypothetical protein
VVATTVPEGAVRTISAMSGAASALANSALPSSSVGGSSPAHPLIERIRRPPSWARTKATAQEPGIRGEGRTHPAVKMVRLTPVEPGQVDDTELGFTSGTRA